MKNTPIFSVKTLAKAMSFLWIASFSAVFLSLGVTGRAANFTTTTSEGAGTDWNANIWSSGAAPTAGNTYELISNGTAWGNNTGNTRVRNPTAAGVQTFAGDSLTLNTNTDIRMKGSGAAILNFPGVGGNPGLILN